MRRNPCPSEQNHHYQVTEKECYEALSYRDLFRFIRYFQEEKRKYFNLYLKSSEKQADKDVYASPSPLNDQKNKYWERHLHFESLVLWCFEETTRRTEKNAF